MIKLKKGVRLADLRPQALLALIVCSEAYETLGKKLMTVTSVNDSQHSSGSLHYSGAAFDLRTRDEEATYQWSRAVKDAIAGTIRSRLSEGLFDVVVEDDHIHVEYQPKEAE